MSEAGELAWIRPCETPDGCSPACYDCIWYAENMRGRAEVVQGCCVVGENAVDWCILRAVRTDANQQCDGFECAHKKLCELEMVSERY